MLLRRLEIHMQAHKIHLFERPITEGWVYPCSLEDIGDQLARLPQDDLDGLWAVGLVPATRKDDDYNGRFFREPRPTIHIYSYRETLTIKLKPGWSLGRIEQAFAVPIEYGMRILRSGSRYVCEWSPEDLRHFIVEHVLLHEIGHHVFSRMRQGPQFRACARVRNLGISLEPGRPSSSRRHMRFGTGANRLVRPNRSGRHDEIFLRHSESASPTMRGQAPSSPTARRLPVRC